MGMAAYATISEFLGKANYEGGIEEALEYGLKSGDLADTPENRSFRLDWTELTEAFKAWEEKRYQFWKKHLEGTDGW